ncbi:TOPRIM domain-containing protein [Syntrophobotulus glycolicus DSM 8271]|uniref:TOPRIM domain-containing protein n=1 Tax=Syntrophobotulus glycolicus (strain DSM 8271 / FlGlyR) TaxID=645991 RepID=F0SYW8_SYNGF|nr:toprim domain-containing protein [Syntrophobotulus glycolicus]ADY56005.1 TOPRIM domain-containing protein [Syntrophobotulus glycolicus DSM 8271]
MSDYPKKAIIVEGKTDKARILKVLDEKIDIICTFGTINMEKLEHLIDLERYQDIYVWADADEAGKELRRKIKIVYPQVRDLYTQKKYREVAATPLDVLAQILDKAHFSVKKI